jgi:predicted phage terminase large subunit-like protein
MYWIADIVRFQKKPQESEEIIKRTAEQDGYNCAVRMEQEPGSSGDITIDHYARNILPGYDFDGVRSTGSKVERARAASSASQGGRVMIIRGCNNLTPFFDEMDVFPYGSKDDTIDGFSGAFNFFRKPIVMSGPSSLSKTSGSYWKRGG